MKNHCISKRRTYLPIVLILAIIASGCNSLEMAKQDLLDAYAENAYADWEIELVQGEEPGYIGIPALEKAVIKHGKAANPVARELLRSFDYRHRCSGLTILIEVNGPRAIREVLIRHLSDSNNAIRWHCWHELREIDVLELVSMPYRKGYDDYIAEWKALKTKCAAKSEAGDTARPK
ncbi:MAG: hypothetical protein K8S55_11905 [Phycisphaerae bacterium]|nr:hypothetical protein [Phycisphaerae bacterium]